MDRQEVFDLEFRRCAFEWCATDHGRTVHADDEDHRSEGVAVALRVRAAASSGPGRLDDYEVGLLRRSADDETWLVVEAPGGVSIAMSREAARAVVHAVRVDRHLRAFVEES
ncbi:hypothetical protein [uncultured Microbacterium sp.]|uniref:hypothetical protein n=1 Tax=uncultured Microbacterium sp. TaxID=191216 RepID=UPI002615D7E5|nr:hypothetical protein [uncultured Microbacterium sp.]